MSRYAILQVAPPIEVFHVNKMCMDDPDPNKVNLGIGAYRTEEGLPWVLPVVRKAEALVVTPENTPNHEYLPVLGFEPYCKAATGLLLGDDNKAIKDGKAFGIQCLSGTGSLRIGTEFLHRVLGHKIIYTSNPTWGNHKLLSIAAGFSEVREYKYWDANNKTVDIQGFIKDLEAAPEDAVILLHGCAHNPTGMDPTQDQWKQICQVVKKRKLFPFFDVAYQGFASGDPAKDAWSVRYFADQGIELLCAQSFAKNMGLYNERVGNLTVVVNDAAVVPAIKSQISLLIRANWSNPPNHGAKVVHMILTNPEMKKEWESHILEMSSRIDTMRKALRQRLETLKTPGTWNHITQQIGMFSYTGLTAAQCEQLTKKHHIYLLKSGRINCCGLTTKNVQAVANAINDIVTNCPANLVGVEKISRQEYLQRKDLLESLTRVSKLKSNELELLKDTEQWKRVAQKCAEILCEEYPGTGEQKLTLAQLLQAFNIPHHLIGFDPNLQNFF